MEINRFEIFLYTSSLEIEDGMSVFVGFHWPMLIARIARRLHAKNFIAVYECGIVEDKNTIVLPTAPTDLYSSVEAIMLGSCLDSLFALLPKLDLSILDAPIVDKFGNVNTTSVGNYYNPKVRLPGAGGGTEVSSLSKKLLIVSSAKGKSRYPEIVDYITSPGYLHGGNERERFSYLKDSKPYALINTYGKFLFDDETKELYLDTIYPMVKIDDIKNEFLWDIKVSQDLKVAETPQKKELNIIRDEIKKARTRFYTIPEYEV